MNTSNTKTVGRPAVIRTPAGVEVKLPPYIPRERALSAPVIPDTLDSVGSLHWIKLWAQNGDRLDPEYDLWIAEVLCVKYQTWIDLMNQKNIKNVPSLFKHSNKSVTEHALWKMIRDASTDYEKTLKSMGLTPESFSSIKKEELSFENDPVFEALKEIKEESRNAKKESIKELEELGLIENE